MKQQTNYQKYQKDRYRQDPEFRKMMLTASHEWQKKNRKRVNEANRKRYENRTPQQIRKRKLYLKNLRARKKK